MIVNNSMMLSPSCMVDRVVFLICGIVIPMAVMPGYPAGAFNEVSDQ
jgi:hypothetical protein